MVSLAATNKRWVLEFIDIKKAHLNGKAKRRVVIKLQTEAGGGDAVLERTFYGTRDAANAWAEDIKTVMINNYFQ